MLYSKTTNGFFDAELNAGNIPADAVEITETEWQALLQGQATGKVIQSDEDGRPVLGDPPPPAVVVPQVVTMVQARLALLSAGLLDHVDTVIGALPPAQSKAAAVEWQFRPTVERDSPLVAVLGPALGLDDAALDALFAKAATL